MSKKESDEEKREMHIERRREADPLKSAKAGRVRGKIKRKKTRAQAQPVKLEKTQEKPITRIEDDFSEKKTSMEREVSSISFRVKNLPSRVNQLDDNIKRISTRMSDIQSNRYFLKRKVEEISKDLVERWSKASDNIENYTLEQSNYLMKRTNQLESNLNQLVPRNDLDKYSALLADITGDINLVENSINSRIEDYQNQFNSINDELVTAENSISNLSNTSIAWKNNEHPFLSVKVEDLSNNKSGLLTLTNFRILFEEVTEVVLKKRLFFATEKKTVREVVLDQPIGSIDFIEKGRVGFLKGAGLFVKFKPQTGLDELKIDTTSRDDDKIVDIYNLIVSGDAEKNLDLNNFDEEHSAPVNCPTCSAPFSDEIYRGQTSVKCKYCGTLIKL